MPAKDDPVVIKKYANRRLYNTGTSTYVTLEDLAEMVKKGEEFTVQDAKTGDDITHPVLTQIIFELENKDGQNMLPIPFLRQLISFYGDQMQMVVPSFLEQSMIAFAKEQERFREQMKSAIGKSPMDMMKIADADQGDRGAGAPQHRDVPERDAAVHAVPARQPAWRAGAGRAGAQGAAGKVRRAAGAEGTDRRDAAQDRFHGVRTCSPRRELSRGRTNGAKQIWPFCNDERPRGPELAKGRSRRKSGPQCRALSCRLAATPNRAHCRTYRGESRRTHDRPFAGLGQCDHRLRRPSKRRG